MIPLQMISAINTISSARSTYYPEYNGKQKYRCLPETSEYKETLDEMNEKFKTSRQMTVLLEDEQKDLSKKVLQNFREVQFLEDIENVEYINGSTPDCLKLKNTDINFDNLQNNE